MDLKELKKVLDNPTTTDDQKQQLIVGILAHDKNAMPLIIQILQKERQTNNDLITDMNLELSRAHIFIDELNPAMLLKKEKQTNLGEHVTKNFMLDNIAAFYTKYKGIVQHCFNRFI